MKLNLPDAETFTVEVRTTCSGSTAMAVTLLANDAAGSQPTIVDRRPRCPTRCVGLLCAGRQRWRPDAGATLKVNDAVRAEPTPFAAFSRMLNVPATVGVPEIVTVPLAP